MSFSTTLAEPREGGACAPGTTPFQENGVDCCITGADASVADVPVPVTFDVDSGVLVWNGRVFAAMPGPEYKVFPPTNTEETYDAAASVLARGGLRSRRTNASSASIGPPTCQAATST
ncbi:MAG: hypothetical protein IPK71_17035 [Myxococcales bacterium]|nr:hypothetical protein [Myxococcales bacterium]